MAITPYRGIFWLGVGLFGALLAAGVARSMGDSGRPPDLATNFVLDAIDGGVARGEYAEATARLRMAAVIHPQPQLLARLVEVAEKAGDRESQIFALRRLTDMRLTEDPQAYLKLGSLLLTDPQRQPHDLPDIENLLRRSLALNPNNAMAHNNLAVTLLYQGKRDEAARHFAQALRLDPRLDSARRGLEQTRRPS